jgi:hypothetical protein
MHIQKSFGPPMVEKEIQEFTYKRVALRFAELTACLYLRILFILNVTKLRFL